MPAKFWSTSMFYDEVKTKIVKPDGTTEETSTKLVREQDLNLYVDGKYYRSFTCIPNHIDELVSGHLYCEDLLVVKSAVDRNNYHSWTKKIKRQEHELDTNTNVFPLVEAFTKNQEIHKNTQGTHACITAVNGKITFVVEDIGRHNALDKAIGHLVIKGADMHESEIFTSARVTTSLVEKCINAGVKSLVTKSVCTSEANKLARGKINLICKAWPDSYEMYC